MMSNDGRSAKDESSRNKFEFITFDDPEFSRTESTRQLVRRTAMRHYHAGSNARRRRRNEIELDVTPLLQHSAQLGNTPVVGEQDCTLQSHSPCAEWSSQSIMQLDAARPDPFFQYPIRMKTRDRELHAHLFDETCVMFRTMRDVGFLTQVQQTAAFCQLLAMSSWHMAHQRGTHNQQTEHLKYSLTATQELQAHINSSSMSMVDNTIAAVLVFACCANLTHDLDLLNVHLNGLQKILAQRGGIHILDSNPVLRIMLYWVDINGSFLQAKPPIFPAPYYLLPRTEEPRIASIAGEDDVKQVIDIICLHLRKVQTEILQQLSYRNVWLDVVFPGFHISPRLGELLQLQDLQASNHAYRGVFEAFRLAAILYVSNLRACFGIDVEKGAMLHFQRLRGILSNEFDCMWATSGLLDPVLVWILAVASTCLCVPVEARDCFEVFWIYALERSEIKDADDLVATLSQFAWSERIFSRETEELRRSHEIGKAV